MVEQSEQEYVRYQGREIQSTLKAPTLEQLELMLVAINEYAIEVGMDEIQLLQKGKDPDGGYQAIIVAHNFNPLTWVKETWEGRGGGLETRLKKEQEDRERRLQTLKLKTVATQEKARQESVRTSLEADRATAESARATAEQQRAQYTQKLHQSVQARRTAASQRRKQELAMKLSTFEEGVKRVGGFAGAQPAILRTALYTPVTFTEEAAATAQQGSKRSGQPLLNDILDFRLP